MVHRIQQGYSTHWNGSNIVAQYIDDNAMDEHMREIDMQMYEMS